jgi:hypothetical protein
LQKNTRKEEIGFAWKTLRVRRMTLPVILKYQTAVSGDTVILFDTIFQAKKRGSKMARQRNDLKGGLK